MRVGIIGTGAISNMHARALKNIGYELTVCTDVFPEAGKKFADTYGCEFVPTYEELCRHPKVDYVDVCTCTCFFDCAQISIGCKRKSGKVQTST